MSFVEKLCKYFSLTNKYINLISNLVESKVLSEDEKLLIFNKKVVSFYSIKYPNYHGYMHKVKLHYLNKLTLYLKLLILNQIKFKHAFLLELRYLCSQIYNKNVEFNLVNLKKMHLNSDIFTQAVSLKLKNRNNRLYRELKSSLSKVKLPNVSRIKLNYLAPLQGGQAAGITSVLFEGHCSNSNKSNKEQLLINEAIPPATQEKQGRNLKINSLFAFGFLSSEAGQGLLGTTRGVKITKDSLNKLLLKNFFKTKVEKTPQALYLTSSKAGYAGSPINQDATHPLALRRCNLKSQEIKSRLTRPISLRNSILRSLKHINMAGIRIEAKGRLTRRFTASRSVFKMR
jgi:hypothetical protein